LYLAIPEPDDSRHLVIHDHHEYSRLFGVSLSAPGVATLAINEIDGLVLDTTFNVIRQYHPAILLAIIHNLGLPLTFFCAPQESIESYDHIGPLSAMKRGLTSSDTSCSPVRELPSRRLCEDTNFIDFASAISFKHCLIYICGQAIGNLVNARGRKEFDVLYQLYPRHFSALLAIGGANLVSSTSLHENRWRILSRGTNPNRQSRPLATSLNA
jgi:hypothetical protein